MTTTLTGAADRGGQGARPGDAFQGDVGELAVLGLGYDKDAFLLLTGLSPPLNELLARQEIGDPLGAGAVVLHLHARLAGLGRTGRQHAGLGAGQADLARVESRGRATSFMSSGFFFAPMMPFIDG